MAFEYPLLLFLLPLGFVFSIWLFYLEFFAIKEIEQSVHKSRLHKISAFFRTNKIGDVTKNKFWIYQIFFCLSFLSLLLSFSFPYESGDAEFETKQSAAYFVFDASWSMQAEDTSNKEFYEFIPRFRFEEARFHAMKVLSERDDFAFGVITFAGESAQHSHPIADKNWIRKILYEQMGTHNTYYSGTNYSAAFSDLLSSSKFLGQGFQVILYSDGDASEEEKSKALESLTMFQRLKIPVHVIALGQITGAEIEMSYNYLNEVEQISDVVTDASGKKYESANEISVQKRMSFPDYAFLKQIADRTGGVYIEVESETDVLSKLYEALEASKDKTQILLWEAGSKKSLVHWCFFLPFLFFLYDLIFIRKVIQIGKVS
ncbi:hypothetical protein LPTSP4_21610 [Leptospira ryugenii]|uniref:Uncharacterized protein n=1 Tax=Leptospira ryugenii TaxID=1917863 RepID=A0A2P2E173_9LEPT|nr:vWA domain-containing protein [Leptospira ryugenii]GBF50635.1 hypothetical protein LPTSP4_21610 [Leptospira ryugenii]